MAKKSYNKFVASAATATLVASALVPTAALAAETGQVFNDVKVDSKYFEATKYLKEKGINGKGGNNFDVVSNIKRGDAIVFLAKSIGFDLSKQVEDQPAGITDLGNRAELKSAVAQLVELPGFNGTIGKGNGLLDPHSNITRGEIALLVNRAYNLPKGDESFTDTKGTKYEEAVQNLVAAGATQGVGNGKFGVHNDVKRGDLAIFLYKSAAFVPEIDVDVEELVEAAKASLEAAKKAYDVAAKELTAETIAAAKKAVADAKVAVDAVVKADEEAAKELVAELKDLTAKVEELKVVDELKVVSVSAINATEILVKFNEKLSKESANDEANYVATINGSSDTIKTAVLQEDGKSVLIRFTTALTNGQTYQLETKNTLLSATYEKAKAFKSDVAVFNDKTAPTVKNVEFNGTDVVATFTEPVTSVANIRVNGVPATLGAAVKDESGNYKYILTSATKTPGTHSVVFSQIKDSNNNETGTQTATYTIVADATAPTVSKLEQVTSNSFKIVFSKPVDGTAVTAISNLKVLKGGVAFDGSRLTPSLSSDKKELTVSIAAPASGNELALYGNNENSVALTVSFDGYKDANGLLGTPYTGSVTLSKDGKAPALLSNKLVSLDANDTIITVTYDEAVDAVTAKNAEIIIKKDNIIQSTLAKPTVADVVGDTTERTVTLTFGTALVDGEYELVLPKGLVKDKEGNDSIQETIKVSVSNAATYFVPTVTGPTQLANTKNEIKVVSATNFTDSVLNVANYTLDDAALPAGTKIEFVDDKKTAVITLPETFAVTTNADYKLGISKNVKDVNGSSVAAHDTNGGNFVQQIGLVDNVAPTLKSAKVVETATGSGQFKQVELTFSEALGAHGSADLLKDFVIKVNGSEVPVNAVAAASGTPVANKVVVTIGDGTATYSTTQTTTITVAPVSTDNTKVDIFDIQGNTLTTGTTVTATK